MNDKRRNYNFEQTYVKLCENERLEIYHKYIIKSLRINLMKIGIDNTKINKVIELCQKAAMFGSMKIVKSVMSRT